ncbi:hypothetical protein MKW92_026768 [Papaver armeniacum]|nr:hypothetical protein MKW92_026768 [Papaver armeniacum]
MNFGIETRAASSKAETSVVTAEKALSFISKGWREVRDSADADFQLMKTRANTFKNLATSFDKELENFLNSATTFSVPAIKSSSSTTTEIDFVKKLQPKFTEFRRVYSSPDFSKKVLEKWSPRARIKLDLSAIRNAMLAEVGDSEKIAEFDEKFWSEWKGEDEDGNHSEWQPIKALKTRFRELEQKSSSSEIFETFKNSEFVEKVKTSLKAMCKEPQDSKEVPPLDVPELLAYLVKQSGPVFDQLGFKQDICHKLVEKFCSKYRSQLLLRSLSSDNSALIENENFNDELDLRIASGLWNDSAKPESKDGKRHFAIVTTASLPWMTGTAVNPLFRAAYLANSAQQNVTLLVPWLCKSDQELVYPNNLTFSSPEEQEIYIRNWLEERVGFKADFKISFYPGKFSKERRSILPAGDTSQFISSKEADIAILEEPEHLNWYHHGRRWTDKFNHVVGVVHTNYLEYIKREKNGALQAFLVKHINSWVTRAYCDKVLRLSAATQDLPKSVICNVHGVNPKFLKVGERVAEERGVGNKHFQREHIS